jgi:hypothetical protein
MTRILVAVLLTGLPAAAAVIRGTVVENLTGKLLARALVTLEALPGTPGGVRSMRATRLGGFEFDNLAAGVYVLKASRRGYIPVEHGQKRWNSAGSPIAIEEAATGYFTLRLPRYSAVSGTVVDENDIGLPGHEVAVYKATQPPEHIRDATTDDRGVYRIGGLHPGKHLVRSVAKQYADGGYLPTFARETVRAEEAQPVELFVEQQTDRVDVRPLPGRLFSLTVDVVPDTDPDTTIVLASGMGRKTVKAAATTFTGLPPGEYEIYAESPTVNAYQRLSLKETSKVTLMAQEPWSVTAGSGTTSPARLRVRRKDLAGVGPEFTAPVPASLPPGRWELLLDPPDGEYASSTIPYTRGRVDGWVEVASRPRLVFGYRLAGGAGSISGTVKEAPYAPVYLEGYDTDLKKRVGDLKAVRTDSRGQYRFRNLAPGVYRLLSTFEYLMPDAETIDSTSPASVTLRPKTDAALDLDLWVIR